MRLEVHSEAREEFLQAVSFSDSQVPGLGLRFITEIERCQKALLDSVRTWLTAARLLAGTAHS